jgi:hypothetical protein
MKLPVPVPSDVLSLVIVGVVVVAQQIPLAVMSALPSDVIFPPETAVVNVIEVIAVVESVATTIGIDVNVTSFP